MGFKVRKDQSFNNLIVNGNLQIPVVATLDNAQSVPGGVVFNQSSNSICIYNGTEWVCGGGGEIGDTNCIQEATTENGVVIEKPLLVNRYGIGRVNLDSELVIQPITTTILNPDNFELTFESTSIVGVGGPQLLLTDVESNYIFKAPLGEQFNNACMQGYTAMYVKIDLQLGFFLFNLINNNFIDISLLINENSKSLTGFYPNDFSNDFSIIPYNDVIKLSPGDEVGFVIFNGNEEGFVSLVKDATFINFTILSFENDK